ncbi:hypothetical protein BH11PSE13_BH11PSE13_14220 [soil metagenome]
MATKRNIRTFGKAFAYLKDPALRTKETNDAPLVVEQALFNGETFDTQVWRSVRFVGCEFAGAYEVKLDGLHDCTFENCRFTGIIGWGRAERVVFTNCQAFGGETNIAADVGSKDVRFEDCSFHGGDEDPNHWGTMGAYGQAEYVRCTAKWFSVFGFDRLVLKDCVLEDVKLRTDSHANSGSGYQSSTVLIEKCALRGRFRALAGNYQSLTIRDTNIDNLDLSNATFKGDVMMERLRGGIIKAGVKSARSFTLANSEVLGSGGVTFEMAMDSVQQVLLENVNFGTGLTAKVNLGPGRPLKENEWNAVPTNKAAVIRNCTLPIVNASWLESQQLTLDGNTIGSINLSNGRIGKLELSGNAIARSVDFSNTQAKESRVRPLATGQAKLDGSNVKVN